MTDLDALRALVAKATPGPWTFGRIHPQPNVRRRTPPGGWPCGPYNESDEQVCADAQLLVAAVNALPALLDRLEAAERDAERYRWLERFDHLTQVNSMLNGIEYTTLNVAVDTAREWELARSDAAREGK